MSARANAIKRLARDLRELDSSPVPNVTAAPSESDIFTWCGNMRGPEKSELARLILHFTIVFPENYPSAPPVIKLPVSIPHPNVQKKKTQHVLCLDMLQERVGNNIYEAWSLGFSALSIVQQIQALLAGPVTIDQAWRNAINAAAATKCPHCEHAPGKVYPSFLTAQEIKERTKLGTSYGAPVVHQLKFIPIAVARPATSSRPAPSTSSTSASSTSTSSTSSISAPASITPSAPKPSAPKHVEEWMQVGRKGKAVAATAATASSSRRAPAYAAAGRGVARPIASRVAPAFSAATPARPTRPVAAAPTRASTHDFSILQTVRCSVCRLSLAPGLFVKGTAQTSSPICKSCKEAASAASAAARVVPRPNPTQLANAPDRNSARHERRARARAEKKNNPDGKASTDTKEAEAKNSSSKTEQEGESKAASTTTTTTTTTTATAPTTATTTSSTSSTRAPERKVAKEDDWNTVEKKQTAADLVATLPTVKAARKPRSLATVSAAARAKAGRFPKLELQLTVGLIQFLTLADIAALATTCTYLEAFCQDGRLWKVLFSREYPQNKLSVSSLAAWRQSFMMETNRLATDLRCYHSKQTFEEDVLGWPLKYTVNPRTNKIDYIASSMDILSSSSFLLDKVRTTMWNETFQEWLPLCFTHEHFVRALPLIEKMLPRLCPHVGASRFTPTMVLEVIPILMNTMAVLLCDQGVHASDKALEGFCLLHRLFVGLVATYPSLQRDINTRLDNFLKSDDNRSKDKVESMGNLLPLLSVTDNFTWTQLVVPLITEQAARNVIWICKEYPRFAEEKTVGQGADPVRNKKSFEASIVSNRLFMFHAYFATEVAHPKGLSLAQAAERADHFYGLPTLAQKRAFKQHVTKILAVEDWAEFFPMVRLQVLSPDAITDWLKKAVTTSLHKRYHNQRTDFTRIQASGTSTIFSRLKREGAKTGEVAFSLMWNNLDDLDLHCQCPCGTHIYYAHRQCETCKGELDVDMNAYDPEKMSEEPVENIFFGSSKKGKYKVWVQNINNRTNDKEVPFEIHAKIQDQQMKLFKKTWKTEDRCADMQMYEFELK